MRQIPLIYESTKTALDGYALGSLPDCLDCKVTEERNGEFFAELKYPAYGMNADLLTVGRLLAIRPNMYDNTQAFRIVTIRKDISGEMEVTAYHVSYDLAQVIVLPFTAANVADALAGLASHSVPASSFTFSTDKTTTGVFSVTQPTPLRALLGGMAGSILDVYGGEFRFDNWSVSLLNSRGSKKNVQVAYGKNLTGFVETDEAGKYDAVLPFAVFDDQLYQITSASVVATAPIVYANGSGPLYGYPKALALDLSGEFSDTAPTEADLYDLALAYISRNATAPTRNMATEYVDLAKLLGSTERVDLCDTIYISVAPYGVNGLTSKVIKIVYDALLDENAEVEIGDRRITLADTLAATIAEAEKPSQGGGGGGLPSDLDISGHVHAGTDIAAAEIYAGGHSSPIGTMVQNKPAADISLSAQTSATTAACNITLEPGVWLLHGVAQFAAVSNASRKSVNIADTAGLYNGPRIRMDAYCQSNVVQQIEASGVLKVTAQKTIYLNVASSRACTLNYQYTTLTATRII